MSRLEIYSLKILAVVPAYNEAKTIGKVVNEVAKFVYKVIVVDDGSTDRTSDVVKNPKGVILRHMVNLGQGAALQTGFEFAKEVGGDIVVTYDADGQFRASEIKNIIAPIIRGDADVVLGSRFLGKTVDIPIVRLLILRLGIFFTYLFSNIKLTDTHNGFRAFSKKAISKINIKHNRWAHPSDIIYQVSRNHFRVIEVPVTVRYTKYSKQKGQSNFEAARIPFQLIMKALLNV